MIELKAKVSKENILKKIEECKKECKSFGDYDIIDVECYVCERESKELSKFCKEVKRAGGMEQYLEWVLKEEMIAGKEEEKKVVVSSVEDLGSILGDGRFKVISVDDYVEIKGKASELLSEFVERSLEELGKCFKKKDSKMWDGINDLVKGIYKDEYKKRYRREFFRAKLKWLIGRGFVFVRLKDDGGVWLQLIYLGEEVEGCKK